MLSHDDIRVQLEAVEPWDRHDHGLRARVNGGAEEGPEYRRGEQIYREWWHAKLILRSCQLRKRPLFFVAHSFGGIILAHVGNRI
jgi:hypothetical protein